MPITYDYQYVKQFVFENNGILLSKEYNGSQDKLLFKCKCGEAFPATFTNFKNRNKRQCNDCGLRSRPRRYRITYADIVAEINQDVGCELVTTKQEYLHCVEVKHQSPTQVEFVLLCESCQEDTFKISLRRVRERKQSLCKSCSLANRTLSYEQVKHYIEVESQTGCKLISTEYKDVSSELAIQCYCGEFFYKSLHDFKDREMVRCKKHSRSKGEIVIRNFLKNHSITFKEEYIFEDCKSELDRHLKYDFAVFDDRDQLTLLIEYQGLQHFEPKKFGIKSKEGAEMKFRRQQSNDAIKREYCINNNIELLEIPYWEFKNIVSILNSKIPTYQEVTP